MRKRDYWNVFFPPNIFDCMSRAREGEVGILDTPKQESSHNKTIQDRPAVIESVVLERVCMRSSLCSFVQTHVRSRGTIAGLFSMAPKQFSSHCFLASVGVSVAWCVVATNHGHWACDARACVFARACVRACPVCVLLLPACRCVCVSVSPSPTHTRRPCLQSAGWIILQQINQSATPSTNEATPQQCRYAINLYHSWRLFKWFE